MSLHTLFVRPEDPRPTVAVLPIKDFEPKVVVSIDMEDGQVSIHLPDMDYAEQLHQRIGNAIQAYVDEMNDTEVGIDLASDTKTDGGTVGVQPGNPTMDTHGPQIEAPSAYVAEVFKAAVAADARRK